METTIGINSREKFTEKLVEKNVTLCKNAKYKHDVETEVHYVNTCGYKIEVENDETGNTFATIVTIEKNPVVKVKFDHDIELTFLEEWLENPKYNGD